MNREQILEDQRFFIRCLICALFTVIAIGVVVFALTEQSHRHKMDKMRLEAELGININE